MRAFSGLILLVALPLAAAGPASDLAPTGTLRATFLADNPVQGHYDPETGILSGPVADIVKELARELNVPWKLVPASNATGVLARMADRSADIGFLAWDRDRAAVVDFSQPYFLMNNSYLVRPGSPLHTSADVDRAGVKVAGIRNQTPEIWLADNLRNTKVIVLDEMPAADALAAMLARGEIDALGVNRGRALDVAAHNPGITALPDSYSSAGQAIVVEKGNTAGIALLNGFIRERIASGFFKQSRDRGKVAGVDIPPVN